MTSIGTYLLEQLYTRGVREIFGLPGDFILNFFECIHDFQKLPVYTFSHEPAVGFAADAAARATGRLTVAAVTYGVGGVNLLNSIACAYAERSPVVVITGGPSLNEREANLFIHHQTKSLESQKRMFKEVTVAQEILDDPETAADQIHYCLEMATLHSRPVYLELPRDQVFSPIRIPKKLTSYLPKPNPETIREAALEIQEHFKTSRHPVLMVGLEVARLGLEKLAVAIAERMKIPVVTPLMARSVFPVHHPQYAGVYLGNSGPKDIQKLVEKSDCLIGMGLPLTDIEMSKRLVALRGSDLIQCYDREVSLKRHVYHETDLKPLMEELLRLNYPKKWKTFKNPDQSKKLKKSSYFGNESLIAEDVIYAIQNFFEKNGEMPLVLDASDCLISSTLINASEVYASAYYTTMGFSVPGGIGVQAATGRRPMVLVGDGAFQMTGPEIAHCQRFGINPIVIVFNNQRWQMLNLVQPKGFYYDLSPWPFSKLASLWGGKGYYVKTRKEMVESLEDAKNQSCFTLIEAQLDRGACSGLLKEFLGNFKKIPANEI